MIVILKRVYMENCQIIPVSASGNDVDIARFIEVEVKRLSSQRQFLGGQKLDKGVRRKTVKRLNEGAQGTFLWVILSLEVLRKQEHREDFKDVLGKLPPGLSGIYNKILEQIDGAGKHARNVAVRTFKWLLCAQRLISVSELIAAVLEDSESEAAFKEDPRCTLEQRRDIVNRN
jgi:hypothetical protein